ncbi:MAG: enhanced serine sensitivity protein SseB C-terminal domain-containing protein [Oscillospiraceae bacterium]
MPSIQELITKFYESDREHFEEAAQVVIDAFLQQETFLIARVPQTKQFFISMESEQQTAIFFSERDTFEKFAEYCMKSGISVDAVEFNKDKRDILFAELWRCGFTRIMIDFLPVFLDISLFDVFTPPDYSKLPLFRRPVIAPRMTGRILFLMQQIHTGKANGKHELDALIELYHSPLFTGANVMNLAGRRVIQVDGHQNDDGTKSILAFTDIKEYMAVEHPSNETPSIVWYPDIKAFMNQGFKTLVINSGSTTPLTLDLQLLNAAEQAATGQYGNFTFNSMTSLENAQITDIENPPEELIQALCLELPNYQQIQSAYLRMLQSDKKLRPSYFLILEAPATMKALSKSIFLSVGKHLQGHDFECTALEKPELLGVIGDTKPFYRKKKISFFRKS